MTDTNSLRTEAGYALGVGLYATHNAMTEAADTIDALRAENERLRTVLKATQEACDPQINADEMMQMAMDSTMLRLQLAEAQKDSERLDWLDRQTYSGANPRGNVWMIGWKGHSISGINFRAAIDIAKREQ